MILKMTYSFPSYPFVFNNLKLLVLSFTIFARDISCPLFALIMFFLSVLPYTPQETNLNQAAET